MPSALLTSYPWEEMQCRGASELDPQGRRLGDSHTCSLQSLPEGGFPRVGWALIPQPFHPPWTRALVAPESVGKMLQVLAAGNPAGE